jgi:hypothetical protein
MVALRLPEQARKLLVSEIELLGMYNLLEEDLDDNLLHSLPHIYAVIGNDTTPHVYFKDCYELYIALSFYYIY